MSQDCTALVANDDFFGLPELFWGDIDHTNSPERLSDPARWRADGSVRGDLITDPFAAVPDLCAAWAYCSDTDTMPLQCDLLVLKRERTHSTVRFAIIVVALLLALPLVQDMDEAITEEEVLSRRRQTHGRNARFLRRLASATLGVSLRVRRCVLPAFISAATAAVIVASSFTVTEVVLSLLSVTFITDVDGMLACLVMTPSGLALANSCVHEADRQRQPTPWMEPRVYALVCVAFVVAGCISTEWLMDLVGSTRGILARYQSQWWVLFTSYQT